MRKTDPAPKERHEIQIDVVAPSEAAHQQPASLQTDKTL
jgi:hypothetical protein